MKKIFCQCYQNYFRHLWLKFLIFQISVVEGGFLGTPKGGVHPPINLEVFFTDIFATARRIYDVIYVGFFRHFSVFGYSKCDKACRNSWFSQRICVLIGSTTLPSIKCNRLCIVKLWRHNHRKSTISSTRPTENDGLIFGRLIFGWGAYIRGGLYSGFYGILSTNCISLDKQKIS